MEIRSLTAVLFVLAFTTFTTAADTAKLLVGKWEAVKADEGTLPVGTIVEFMADGKMKITPKVEAKEKTPSPKPLDGSYLLEGDTFTYNLKTNDKDYTSKIKITKITETELETLNADKKNVSFKKVK
jgi:uncharacterized protein (TIGR03066 family)